MVGGASYGGRLAIEVALAAPERVQALWVMGANHAAPDRERSLGLADMIETRFEDAVATLAGLVVAERHTGARATFEAMAGRVGGQNGAAQMRALANGADLTDRLAAVRVPALLLWGKQDGLAPTAIGQKLADALPNARLVELDECGHLPTLEQPAEVARIVAEWLGNDVRAGAVAA